jgi:hypothetical protein
MEVVYTATLIKKVRIRVWGENEDAAWEAAMDVSPEEWETVGVPIIEDIETLEVYHQDEVDI